MAGNFSFNVDKKDWQRLQNIVKDMEKIDGNQAILNSLSKGMKDLTIQGKSNLISSNNSVTGNLKNSISNRRVKKTMSVYGGFRRGRTGGPHAHLVDRGTNERWTKKGYYRGSVSKGKPNTGTRFWTKAVENKGPQIMTKTMDVIYNEIEKITKRKKI